MGQLQPKEGTADGGGQSGRTNAIGNRLNMNDLKDRVNAKFGDPHMVNPAYGRGGSGSKGNPGKPT